MKDIIITCNLIVRFSKFTLNKKIYERFEEFLAKLETIFIIIDALRVLINMTLNHFRIILIPFLCVIQKTIYKKKKSIIVYSFPIKFFKKFFLNECP